MTIEEAKKVTIDDLFARLSANEKGLSSSEVEKRLQRYGPNEIPEKKVNPVLKFLSYFWGCDGLGTCGVRLGLCSFIVCVD